MRIARHATLLCWLALSEPHLASAQGPSTTFGAFRVNLTVVDNAQDQTLDGMGFQLAGSLGRPLAPGFAWVGEVALTTVSRHTLDFPCASPGCGNESSASETGVSVAPGFQLYAATGAMKVATTLTPGVLWFVSRPAGARTLVPRLGARVDVGWLLPDGPRLGLGVGVDWWGTAGTMPRWAVPVGFTIGVR